MTRIRNQLGTLLVSMLLLVGCGQPEEDSRGQQLPGGDVERAPGGTTDLIINRPTINRIPWFVPPKICGTRGSRKKLTEVADEIAKLLSRR